MAVDEGYAFVSPKGAATARALLDAAKHLGLEASVVRSTMGGYYVPIAVSKRYEKDALGGTAEEPPIEEPTEEPDSPNETWKNADIVKWASDHGVDLGDATKKADMLAAISSADTKEE